MMAPPVQFPQQAYLPLLARMGAEVDIALLRYGFYPAGGGEVIATVKPCAPMALAGGGSFTASTVSSHDRTNAHVISRFFACSY